MTRRARPARTRRCFVTADQAPADLTGQITALLVELAARDPGRFREVAAEIGSLAARHAAKRS